jgi:hypothetical protein
VAHVEDVAGAGAGALPAACSSRKKPEAPVPKWITGTPVERMRSWDAAPLPGSVQCIPSMAAWCAAYQFFQKPAYCARFCSKSSRFGRCFIMSEL